MSAESSDVVVDGIDRDAGGAADVDDFEISLLDELVDRAASHAEGAPGALDTQQEDWLPGGVRSHFGRDGMRFGDSPVRASLRRFGLRWAGALLSPQRERGRCGAVSVRVSPPIRCWRSPGLVIVPRQLPELQACNSPLQPKKTTQLGLGGTPGHSEALQVTTWTEARPQKFLFPLVIPGCATHRRPNAAGSTTLRTATNTTESLRAIAH